MVVRPAAKSMSMGAPFFESALLLIGFAVGLAIVISVLALGDAPSARVNVPASYAGALVSVRCVVGDDLDAVLLW